MLIICPNCSSSYLVRAEEVRSEGKLVRCGVCKTSWRPELEADRNSPPTGSEAHDNGATLRLKADNTGLKWKRSHWTVPLAGLGALATAWVAAVVVPSAGAMDDVLSRARNWLADILPDDPAEGLRLTNVRTHLATDGGEAALVIEGEIFSERSGDRPLPGLQFTMTDAEANAIFQWMIPAPAPSIASGTTLPFTARLASPPRDAKDIRIRFAGA